MDDLLCIRINELKTEGIKTNGPITQGIKTILLLRSHAEVVVDDEVFLPVFKKFCKRRPPVDTGKGRLNIKLQKQHNCIPDEHYVPTLFAVRMNQYISFLHVLFSRTIFWVFFAF
ncbi:glycosyltransferase BC10-like [Hibiscus syriacus]|uniref:glycosyltransferase BC10-like n=1 Tax=Hibiscus syriacus TaxID=106335 RepID=UPI00192302A5|nr:glycosyltransferase BC10-like [Hibiscus syriacus]